MQVLVKAVLVDQLIISDKSRNQCIEQRDKLRKADSIYVKSKDKKKKESIYLLGYSRKFWQNVISTVSSVMNFQRISNI